MSVTSSMGIETTVICQATNIASAICNKHDSRSCIVCTLVYKNGHIVFPKTERHRRLHKAYFCFLCTCIRFRCTYKRSKVIYSITIRSYFHVSAEQQYSTYTSLIPNVLNIFNSGCHGYDSD